MDKLGLFFRWLLRKIPGPLIGLVLVCVVFSYLSPYFFTTRNLFNIFSQMSEIGIMAVGAALVIIIAGIDLSVGAVLAVRLVSPTLKLTLMLANRDRS